jgi:hypothetical protein
MEQARHGAAANALSFGKHFLCIAKVNGHCSAEMITKGLQQIHRCEEDRRQCFADKRISRSPGQQKGSIRRIIFGKFWQKKQLKTKKGLS